MLFKQKDGGSKTGNGKKSLVMLIHMEKYLWSLIYFENCSLCVDVGCAVLTDIVTSLLHHCLITFHCCNSRVTRLFLST